MSNKLWIATTNRAKMSRIKTLLGNVHSEWAESTVGGPSMEVEESMTSHIANAILKAVNWSMRLEGLAVSSDGGLVIPSLLDRWNSVGTKRLTGTDADDAQHAHNLLGLLGTLTGEDRAAWFVEAIAVADAGVLIGAWQAEGLKGVIADAFIPEPAATSGFWISGLWQQNTEPWKRLWQLDHVARIHLNDPWYQLEFPVRNLVSKLAGPR